MKPGQKIKTKDGKLGKLLKIIPASELYPNDRKYKPGDKIAQVLLDDDLQTRREPRTRNYPLPQIESA